MKIFEHFKHKNTEAEFDLLYEMLDIDPKTKTSSIFTKQELKKIGKLLKWNSKIEKLEEGKESGHTLRVAYLSNAIAEELGLDMETRRNLYLAAIFHDIGKYFISPKIVGKPGPLTDEEYEFMKTHTVLAEKLIKGLVNDSTLEIVKSHHERMDGSGYPQGIIVEDICVKILGLVDSYDAMTSNRVYNTSKSKELAFQELDRCSIPREEGGFGFLYDPDLISVLKKIETEK